MPSRASDPILLLTTLYPSRKMEKDGVVESSWETSTGGPARRKYAITNAGEARLGGVPGAISANHEHLL